MLTVHTDIKVTRRKGLHFVLDGEEALLFSASRITAVFEYLLANGHSSATFDGEDGQYHITIAKWVG